MRLVHQIEESFLVLYPSIVSGSLNLAPPAVETTSLLSNKRKAGDILAVYLSGATSDNMSKKPNTNGYRWLDSHGEGTSANYVDCSSSGTERATVLEKEGLLSVEKVVDSGRDLPNDQHYFAAFQSEEEEEEECEWLKDSSDSDEPSKQGRFDDGNYGVPYTLVGGYSHNMSGIIHLLRGFRAY